MARILVLGGGFAGLWSAIGAARAREMFGAEAAGLEIRLIDRHPTHNIRVRNYETDLTDVAIPLAEVLDPIDVAHAVGEVEAVDPDRHEARVATPDGIEPIGYDRLVLAVGSVLPRPEFLVSAQLFDVDTYAGGQRLNAHIAGLGVREPSSARDTVVVVGAGFTGLEVAAEMPAKLRCALGDARGRVVLIDRNPCLGAAYSEDARAILRGALENLGVEVRLGVEIADAEASSVRLKDGETIPTQTLVWCAGMRASPLAAAFPGAHDALGRLVVDQFMRVPGIPHAFAAGDAAVCRVEDGRASLMSCQHARPTGRFADYNVVADLLGQPLLPMDIDWYVTVLDLGAWGALYTVGRERRVLSWGPAAKVVKQTINRHRIYPPRNGLRAEILAAGAPLIQRPPEDVRRAMDD